MDRNTFRGIFVIVTTPFTEDLAIDEDGLRSTLRFCLDSGVHGVVSTANASEVGYLSDAERRRVAEIVVEEAKGRAQTVVGVSANHWRMSAGFADHAGAIGADAIMAMPPTFHPANRAEIKAHYQAISAASDLPLILQNAIGLGATVMSAELLVELVNELPNARFIKEETAYPAQMTGEVKALAGDRLIGVMGGRAGKTLMEELPHGICGTMPACEFADVHVALWTAIEAGDMALARTIFRCLLPLLDYEATYGIPLCKEVEKARGIIAGAHWRQTGYRALDDHARAEMLTLLDGAVEYMNPKYPHRPA
ncbi:dihydrodipicolinate synthase family protein [uncultured Martelella sp.]|uniref:dihydrodipicolinate synthase family protein n=1 Tax=uncultured Martelella sp. TaxID=392331 RepID=UPI0029C601F7|nr:dihydrodipicolinate synthase family protein [uncultured Martelella sp.]